MATQRMISTETAIYHCMSRTVNGDAFFGDGEKEVMRKMLARVADFSGVEVLTYCLMSNHFHVLVRVPAVDSVSDAELTRRFGVLYPNPTDFQAATVADVKRILAADDDSANELRFRLLARMGDVSEFMKTLKQRFSIWYNKSHSRFGPVWSDRFKSVLVEGHGFALQTVAAYIDLNPVRAGLVNDPKDYRFCGYAAAVAGQPPAIEAIRSIISGETQSSPAEAMQSYRQLLFGKGGAAVSGAGQISHAAAIRVLEKQDGILPTAILLRCRIRYFTDGAILGSQAFVQSYLEGWKAKRQRKHLPKVRKISGESDTLAFINRGRGRIFS